MIMPARQPPANHQEDAMTKIAPEQLVKNLADHALWLDSNQTRGARANLAGADLAGWDLAGANLAMANLAGANLPKANLSEVNLSGANLREANLMRADLSPAKPEDAPPPKKASVLNLGYRAVANPAAAEQS